MADDNVSQPFYPISGIDHGAWVFITSIVFLVYSFIGVGAKVVSRWHFSALRKPFDVALLIAFAFAVAQTVVVVKGCQNGLGRHRFTLSDSSFESVTKYLYTASILSILAHTAAKLSVAMFVATITPRKDLKFACWALLGIIVVWGICAVFLIAFRCSLPNPWFGPADKCLSLYPLYLGIDLTNIVTDIALVVLPAVMMWTVQTSFDKRMRVVALFACRILVPATLIPQIVFWGRTQPKDLTWALVTPTMWGQVAMNLSILTACIPSLKGVLEMFFSGAALFQVPTRYESDLATSSQGYGLRSLVPSRFRVFKSKSGIRSNGNSHNRSMMRNENGNHVVSVSRRGKEDTVPADRERSESQVSLHDGRIMRTVEYEISSYPRHDPENQGHAPSSDGVSYDSVERNDRYLTHPETGR